MSKEKLNRGAQEYSNRKCESDAKPEGVRPNAADGQPPAEIDATLPRPERRSKRSKQDRGLPPDEILGELAAVYLKRQRQHWPKLVRAGLLPEPSAGVLNPMVEDFKERHRTGKVDVETVRPFTKHCKKLAGNYDRYSCENSSPLSIQDQMYKCLDKAHEEKRFIPWQYVFCDYSVSGLDASRRGYTSYKAVLKDEEQLIETTYIDDFTRASRDELEWWKLAEQSKRLRKRLIGASDGFNLDDSQADLLIGFYGILSRLMIKGLREKVTRGMSGAARRGTCLGKLSLGFTRRQCCNQDGKVVCDAHGQPIYERCIDPATRDHRRLLYELFAISNWSVYRIARHFNQLKVDGWDGWTESTLKTLLANPDAIGVIIWNRYHREYDSDAKKWIKVQKPRAEWVVRFDPDLAIIPLEWWRLTRRKLAAMRRDSPLTGRKLSRNEVSATTLFSGTLFCEYCGAELKLIRSDSKYKQVACLNGMVHAKDCELIASKSVRIIEECLVNFINSTLLNDVHVESLVSKANAVVEEEAQKPQVDTRPWKSELRRYEASIKKLFARLEAQDDDALCEAYDKQIATLQKSANELRTKIAKAGASRRKIPQPLPLDRAMAYLVDLRELLQQEIPAAAEALRALTGRITIRQESIPGKSHGARWIATFSPDFFRALHYVIHKSRGAVPNLPAGTVGEAISIPIEEVPKYELWASRFKQLHENGASFQSLASMHNISWQYAKEILHFANTGERPKWKARKRNPGGPGTPAKYPEIAEQVVELRDKQKMSFTKIAKQLKVGENTVRRAYDYARPQAVEDAAQSGTQPKRGRYAHLDPEKFAQIREMLRADVKVSDIAKQVGCGCSTVYRVKKQLGESGQSNDAAA